MVKVILHLGAGKCGSSAIQHFLRDRRGQLWQKSVLVPDKECSVDSEVTGDQIWFFERLRNMDAQQASRFARESISRLIVHAERNGLHTIVISAENLSNLDNAPLALNGLEKDCELRLVFYVRRQLDFLVSAWQQWYVKVFPDAEAFLQCHLDTLCNWDRCLALWEQYFGVGRIRVRRFGKGLLHDDDIVSDFFHTVGLSVQQGTTGQRVNRSYCDAMTAICSQARDQFQSEHDNRLYCALHDLVGDDAFRRQMTTYPFYAEQVARIERVCRAGNRAVKERYFPELAGADDLFPSASEDGIEPLPEARLREQVEALVRRAETALARQGSSSFMDATLINAILSRVRDTDQVS